MPQAFGVTSEQYTVYALTIETKIEEGLSGNCSRLKDVSKELDHSRMVVAMMIVVNIIFYYLFYYFLLVIFCFYQVYHNMLVVTIVIIIS